MDNNNEEINAKETAESTAKFANDMADFGRKLDEAMRETKKENETMRWGMRVAGIAAIAAAIGIGAYLWVNRGSADEDAE